MKRFSYAFGVYTSAIFNSILLLEYSMKARLYKERLKNNSNIEWSSFERLNISSLIPKLMKAGLIDKHGTSILDDFNNNLRNPYLHFNIYKLIQGIAIDKLPRLNIETDEVTEQIGVDAKKHRFMWFGAKQFFDRERVQYVIDFCVFLDK